MKPFGTGARSFPSSEIASNPCIDFYMQACLPRISGQVGLAKKGIFRISWPSETLHSMLIQENMAVLKDNMFVCDKPSSSKKGKGLMQIHMGDQMVRIAEDPALQNQDLRPKNLHSAKPSRKAYLIFLSKVRETKPCSGTKYERCLFRHYI